MREQEKMAAEVTVKTVVWSISGALFKIGFKWDPITYGRVAFWTSKSTQREPIVRM